MANQQKGKDLLIGAVVGGLLGAATALLFAPKSGRELRSDIAEQAQVVSDKTVQIASTVSQKAQTAAKTVSVHTSELIDKAKEAASTVVESVLTWKESKKGEETTPELEASEAAEDWVIVGK